MPMRTINAITFGVLLGACCMPAFAKGDDIDRLMAALDLRKGLAPAITQMLASDAVKQMSDPQVACLTRSYTVDAVIASLRPTFASALPDPAMQREALAFVDSSAGHKIFDTATSADMSDAQFDAIAQSMTDEEAAAINDFMASRVGVALLSEQFTQLQHEAIARTTSEILRTCNIES